MYILNISYSVGDIFVFDPTQKMANTPATTLAVSNFLWSSTAIPCEERDPVSLILLKELIS